MKFYRYDIVEYAEHDIDGELIAPTYPNPKIELRVYELKKETPCGYWICLESGYSWKKWISKTSKKRFAYPTKKEAMINLIKRTETRLRILNRQVDLCKSVLYKVRNEKVFIN